MNVNGLKRIREFDKVTIIKERKMLCLAVVNSLSMNFEINSHKYFEAALHDGTANEHLVACPQLSKMFFQQTTLDHNDPSKPSHRLTNGPEPSKTIESDGSNIKNHRKTIDANG